MKRLLTIVLIALLGVASCKKDDVATATKGVSTITANTAAVTKISLDTNFDGDTDVTTWNAGDQIKFFEVVYSATNSWYQLTSITPPDIYYTLSKGAGTSSGTFTSNSGNTATLDPNKKYVAFHSGDLSKIGTASDGTNYPDPMVSFTSWTASSTPAAINYTGNKAWAEKYLILRANVEFDGSGKVKPLQFQNDVNSMFEFKLSTDGIAPDFEVNNIVFDAGGNFVPQFYRFYFDKNMYFDAKAVSAYSKITYTFTNLPKITKTPITVRIPIFIRPTGYPGAKTVSFTVNTKAGETFSITKIKGSATTNIFPAGKTYVIPLLYASNSSKYPEIFTDKTYSELNAGVTAAMIKTITDPVVLKIAQGLFDKSYDTKYRVAEYRPYQNPSVMATKNKTNKYSIRDNPTGIYVNAGQSLTVFVGPLNGQTVNMQVCDLSYGFGSQKYTLREGANELEILNSGLVYIENFTNIDMPLILETVAQKAAAKALTVKIHFANADVNGYFELGKNTQAEFVAMLKNAKPATLAADQFRHIDVVGKYSHITWNVAEFLKGSSGGSTPTDIIATITNYDNLVYWQWDLLGLFKYNSTFNNRSYFHADYKTSTAAYATDYRTAYRSNPSSWNYYAQIFCEPSAFASRAWGPAHEVGHCNQTTGLKWAGMTEVTNNIMSLYVTYKAGNTAMAEASYTKATLNFTTNGIAHGATGPVMADGTQVSFIDSDYRIRLVPFWQLFLYMNRADAFPDFYKDLYQQLRATTASSDSGEQQLNFVRLSCQVSNMNLLDFFQKRGFLTPIDADISDYGTKRITITKAQIDALIAEIKDKNYPLPARKSNGAMITNLHLITDSNISSYN